MTAHTQPYPLRPQASRVGKEVMHTSRVLDPAAYRVRKNLAHLESAAPSLQGEGAITLRDGRELAFALFGNPAGNAVMWFHGTAGARGQLPPDAVRYTRGRGLDWVLQPGS